MQGIGIILLYVVIIGAFYLIAIRPQKIGKCSCSW